MPVISVSHVTDGSDNTDATAYNTASFTPSANQLVLVAVLSESTIANSVDPTLSGGGLGANWVLVGGSNVIVSTRRYRLNVFRGLLASPGASAALTITHSATQLACAWSVDKFSSVDTSGTNGSGAVRQIQTAQGTGRNGWQSYGAFLGFNDPDNILWSAFALLLKQASVGVMSLFSQTADRAVTDGTVPAQLGTGWGYGIEEVSWGSNVNATLSSTYTGSSISWIMDGIEVVAASGGLTAGQPTSRPTVSVFLNLNNPTSSTKNWVDISARVMSYKLRSNRTFELDKPEMGTAEIEMRNHDRALDPNFAAGPYFGNLYSEREIRIIELWKGHWKNLFYGFVDTYDFKREGFNNQTTTLKVNDAREPLGQETLTPPTASLTTSFGSNADLTFTAKGSEWAGPKPRGRWGDPPWTGHGNGGLSIQYVIQSPGQTPMYSDFNATTRTVTFFLANTGSGVSLNNALDILRDCNIKFGDILVCSLAPGSSGLGKPSAFGPSPLVGAYPADTAGGRIHRILDTMETPWAQGDRVIDAGAETIAPTFFDKKDNVSAISQIDGAQDADLGLVYMDGLGRVVFQDRNHRTGASVTATVTDKPGVGGEYPYTDIDSRWDTAHIINDVTVVMEGYTTVASVTATASDTTSKNRFRKRSKTFTMAVANSSSLSTIASAMLAKYKDQKYRYDSLSFQNVGAGDPLLDVLFDWNFSTLLTVHENPVAGAGVSSPQISGNHFVEGREIERQNDGSYNFKFYLSPQ